MEPVGDAEPVNVAEVRERHALDEFHDEERPAALGRAGVQEPGDVRVIHERDGLPFRLEARQNGLRLPALDADQLDRHAPLDRFRLVGHPDRAHASFADLLQQLVSAGNDGPGDLHVQGVIRFDGLSRAINRVGGKWLVQERIRPAMRRQ